MIRYFNQAIDARPFEEAVQTIYRVLEISLTTLSTASHGLRNALHYLGNFKFETRC
jgi:hypothetical protein